VAVGGDASAGAELAAGEGAEGGFGWGAPHAANASDRKTAPGHLTTLRIALS
jgi:hypothetical protein